MTGRAGGALVSGVRALLGEARESVLPVCLAVRGRKRSASEPALRLSLERARLDSDLRFPAPRTGRRECLLFKACELQPVATAAELKQVSKMDVCGTCRTDA